MDKSFILQYLPEVIAAIGALWAMFKLDERISAWTATKQSAALSKLEGIVTKAIAETSKEYTDQLKAARADGKISEEEARVAMTIALNKVRSIAREEGLNLIQLAACQYLPGLVEKVLTKNKS